jgi:AraC-like DNA-binding protein
MALEYILPRADLRDHVRAYYYFSVDQPTIQPLCAEMGNIRVGISGSGFLHTPDGHRRRITADAAYLIGPTMGAYCMEAEAGSRLFGIGIRPKGWITLCGMNAEDATDSLIDLTSFAGGIARGSIEEMRNAGSLAEMAGAADRFFARLINRRAGRTSNRYPDALASWLLNPNDLCMDELLDMMDVSRRSTDRIAKMYFGASPKFLQRKYRALRAADRIRAGGLDWMSAAGEAYYDQSHFIKEFKTFVGVTPKQFIGNQAQLISEIQSQRRAQALTLPLASF